MKTVRVNNYILKNVVFISDITNIKNIKKRVLEAVASEFWLTTASNKIKNAKV